MSLDSDEDDDGGRDAPSGAANGTGEWWTGGSSKKASPCTAGTPKISRANVAPPPVVVQGVVGSPATVAGGKIKLTCPSCKAATSHDPVKPVVVCKYCAARFPMHGSVAAPPSGAKSGERCPCGAAKKGACFICG